MIRYVFGNVHFLHSTVLTSSLTTGKSAQLLILVCEPSSYRGYFLFLGIMNAFSPFDKYANPFRRNHECFLFFVKSTCMWVDFDKKTIRTIGYKIIDIQLYSDVCNLKRYCSKILIQLYGLDFYPFYKPLGFSGWLLQPQCSSHPVLICTVTICVSKELFHFAVNM